VIVAIDGEEVRDSDDVAAAVSAKRPGDEVEVEYFRGDDRRTANVELTERPASADVPSDEEGDGGGLLP
jgi:S1-C subfamily serine protease